MNLWFYSLSELDFEALMMVYEEGNICNGVLSYPDESATMQVRLAEQDFADYLRQTFFRQEGASYCILAENGSYISAARIEKFDNGYLLSALETRPDYRRKGYGKRLMEDLLCECTGKDMLPIYSHVNNNNTASLNLHLQCGFHIYKDSARYLDGSVRSDTNTLIYEKWRLHFQPLFFMGLFQVCHGMAVTIKTLAFNGLFTGKTGIGDLSEGFPAVHIGNVYFYCRQGNRFKCIQNCD